MPESQDFLSDDCHLLVPQGLVLQEQRFVRVSLLGKTIDEQLAQWDRDDGSVYQPPKLEVRIGLPLHVIAPWAWEATLPHDVALKGDSRVALGADMVYLPNLLSPRRVDPVVVRIAEADLLGGKAAHREGDLLSSKLVSKLLRTGSVNVRRDGRIVRYELQSAQPRQGLQPTSSPQAASTFMYSGLPSGLIPEIYLTLVITEGFNGSMEATVEAFLADPRAGVWHDPQYARVSWISAWNDALFEAMFAALRARPEWNKLTQHPPTPPLPTFPIAVVTVFRQTHTLTGYTRGRLVESVTVGPDENVTTEIFTFDRLTEERTDEFASEFEATSERKRNQSNTTEISDDVQNSVGAGVGGQLGLSLPVETVNVDGGVSGDVRTEVVTQNQTTATMLTEAAVTASERYKATHQVKTVTRREAGVEQRTTRTFRNPNLGRTLNLYHFEVLGNYEVRTEVDESLRLALLVDNPPVGPFDRDWIRAHHHFLEAELLHDVYRRGLEAAQLLAAQEWLDEQAAAEMRSREEDQQRRAAAPGGTGATSAPNPVYVPNKGIFATARNLKQVLEVFLALGGLEAAVKTIRDHLSPFVGVSASKLAKAEKTIARTAWWTQFNLAYPGMTEEAGKFVQTMQVALAGPDKPESADDVVAAVGRLVERLDDDWLLALKVFGAGYVLSELAVPLALFPPVYVYIMKLMYQPDDLGLPKILSAARADYAQHRAKQTVETLAPPMPPVASTQSLAPAASPVPPPPRAHTLKELAEARAAFDRLVLHLDAHADHYTNAFMRREDPALRMTRLTQIGVAPFVENRLLGFAGTRSIFPLRLEALPNEVRSGLEALLPGGGDASPPPVVARVTVPTGGIVSEVALGACDALEPYLADRRVQELRERALRNQLLELEVAKRRRELGGGSDDDG